MSPLPGQRIPVRDADASPAPSGRLAQLGLAMRLHPHWITALQVVMVACYLVLLVWPVLLPLPGDHDRILGHPSRFAQFLFWAVWWPGVILAVMLAGRFWCGVLCPEGALSEWVSRIGLGRGIPRWMKWPLWPLVAFILTTVYGQLVSVYEYPQAALLVLGGSTAAAMLVGLLYGRGKRVWCRHLCPVSGVFAVLGRLSVLHFQVDQPRWDSAPAGQRSHRGIRVNCAPMIDIRRQAGSGACHACGRCAGQRGAVELALRSPGHEVRHLTATDVSTGEAWLLLYGMIGVAIGAFRWSSSPTFVSLKQTLAEWLVLHEWWWPLGDSAPWWLLTHYPEANDVFSWLDGAIILMFISGVGMMLGTTLLLSCRLSARWLGRPELYRVLALSYAPIAGVGLILGLSMTTVTQLQAEGVDLNGIDSVRAALLAAGAAGSLWLAWRQTNAVPSTWQHLLAVLPLSAGVAMVATCWITQFWNG